MFNFEDFATELKAKYEKVFSDVQFVNYDPDLCVIDYNVKFNENITITEENGNIKLNELMSFVFNQFDTEQSIKEFIIECLDNYEKEIFNAWTIVDTYNKNYKSKAILTEDNLGYLIKTDTVELIVSDEMLEDDEMVFNYKDDNFVDEVISYMYENSMEYWLDKKAELQTKIPDVLSGKLDDVELGQFYEEVEDVELGIKFMKEKSNDQYFIYW